MSGPEVDTEEQVPEAVEEAPVPLAPPVPEPPANVAPVVVPRWIQLVVLPLALLGLWAVARAAGPVLLLFIVAGLIALLLNPFVTLLRRARFPRGAAVATVYLVLLLAVAGIGVLLANPVANQVSAFRDEVPSIVDSANDNLADLQGWLDDNGIDLQVSKPGKTAVDSLGDRIAEGSGELVAFTRDALLRLAETSIALILIFVLSIYMLLYGERIGAAVRAVVPPGDGSPEDDFPTRIQGAVFGYVRGQLLFSLIMGTSAGVCLYVLGVARDLPRRQDLRVRVRRLLRLRRADPVRRAGGRRLPAGDDRAVQRRAARRAVAVDHVHRAAADRGPHRRAQRVRPRAAHQPAAGDLRAAARRADLRLHRRVHRAAAGGDRCARRWSTCAAT